MRLRDDQTSRAAGFIALVEQRCPDLKDKFLDELIICTE